MLDTGKYPPNWLFSDLMLKMSALGVDTRFAFACVILLVIQDKNHVTEIVLYTESRELV